MTSDKGKTSPQLNRERAPFVGSRLYRQAAEGAEAIAARFAADDVPFEEPLIVVTGAASYAITDASHCSEVLVKARDYADAKASVLSTYTTIPILLHAISSFYTGRQEPIWLGTALKLTLTLAWRNVFNPSTTSSKSLSHLFDAIAAAALFELLDNLARIYSLSGEESGIAELNGRGFGKMNDHLREARSHYAVTFRRRGRILRTATESMQVLMRDSFAALHAIENVLRGQSPSTQDVFRSTLFAVVPDTDDREFWAHLWVRLKLMQLAVYFRSLVTDDVNGITLFETLALPNKGIDGRIIQRVVRQCLWTREWYEAQRLDDATALKNMIVDRAVTRITTDAELYGTSLFLLGDSLNWFVEASVFGYPGGTRLSENVFRIAVSEPFEEDIREMFRQHNFVAGRVTGSGAWMTGKQNIILAHAAAEACPGEIDVLAFRESSQDLLVCECKVLRLPFTRNQARNVLERITKEFNANLRRKLEWISECTFFSDRARKRVHGIIVLDRRLPGMLGGEFLTVDAETLSEALAKL